MTAAFGYVALVVVPTAAVVGVLLKRADERRCRPSNALHLGLPGEEE
jgi:hypothetical protein